MKSDSENPSEPLEIGKPKKLPEEADEYGADELGIIVSELEDLVKVALAAEKKEIDISVESFVDVHKKLMSVYKMIEEFRDTYAQSLAAFGLKPEDVTPTPEDVAKLGTRERKLMDKIGSLKEMCEEAKERVHESLQQSPTAAVLEVKEELKPQERKAQRRKSKFKGVGGKQGWIP